MFYSLAQGMIALCLCSVAFLNPNLAYSSVNSVNIVAVATSPYIVVPSAPTEKRSTTPSNSEMTFDQAYKVTHDLCKYEPGVGAYLKQSGKSLRFFWEGLKTFGGNPFRPTTWTQSLMDSPGYWEALRDCYGNDKTYIDAFTFTIVLLDDLGMIENYVGLIRATNGVWALLGTSRFALAFPRVFTTIGWSVFGYAITETLLQARTEWNIYQQRRNAKKSAAEFQKNPEESLDRMVNLEVIQKEVLHVLEEAHEELRQDLKNKNLLQDIRTAKEIKMKALEEKIYSQKTLLQQEAEAKAIELKTKMGNTNQTEVTSPVYDYGMWN